MVSNAKSDASQTKRLEVQLVDADGFLARSLNQEDRNRRNKRRWLVGIACMLATASCAVAILIFTNPSLLASDKSSQGWALWRQRRLPEAEAKFREALMENAKDGDAWTGLGWSLTNVGRLKEALDAFKHAIEIAPDNISAQNGLGQCGLGTGDLALAEEYLKKSAEGLVKQVGGEEKVTTDSLPAAWYGLVNLYLLKDDFAQAKQWADRIAKVNPKDETLKPMMEQIDKKDSSATKRLFGRAGEQTEDTKRAKAWQLWSSGQPDKAIDLFRELVTTDPKDANSFNGLGWSLLNTGKSKEAMGAFLQCLKLDEKHAAALNGVGQSALAAQDWAKADEYLTKASDRFLEEVPESKLTAQNLPAAWFGLARLHLVQGNYDKATEWLQRILKYDTGNADAKQMLGWAEKKDNSEIKKLFGL